VRITRRQLKKIIKEDTDYLLAQAVWYDVLLPALEAAGFTGDKAYQIAQQAVDAGMNDMSGGNRP